MRILLSPGPADTSGLIDHAGCAERSLGIHADAGSPDRSIRGLHGAISPHLAGIINVTTRILSRRAGVGRPAIQPPAENHRGDEEPDRLQPMKISGWQCGHRCPCRPRNGPIVIVAVAGPQLPEGTDNFDGVSG
jgi:hypothetical protein